jgi:hypothetical protein
MTLLASLDDSPGFLLACLTFEMSRQIWINSNISSGYEVITAVTMKNVVFWDIKTQFVLHRRHITSPLHSPAS